MIKNVKIRILAFFMAVTLSFCVCSNEYYEVNALEWVAPVIGLDTALKALLGLLGVTVSAGLASQIDWSDVRDDAVNYQIQKGNDAVAVSKWWDKVISGGLDTASSCWTSFKEWVSNELLSGSSGGSGIENGDAFTILQSRFPNLTTISPDSLNSDNIAFGWYTISISDNELKGVTLLNNTYTLNTRSYTYQGTNYNIFDFASSASSGAYSYASTVSDFSVQNIGFVRSNRRTFSLLVDDTYKYYIFGADSSLIDAVPNYFIWDINEDSDFDSAVNDIGVIGLAPDVATDLPYDGVIDIPWENVGATDTAIDDAFDDAIDKVNTGTWTLDQYWTWVQNITNVFAYDTTNNFLLPNDGDDEKADDKIQENINRGAMVLYGLEKVFPFCIPWDIYAFVNLLVADPVAPVIEYPIYNPVSGEDETIIIDFSVWESQVILMRYIQDFLLIIGLLLLARSLIGAGGSD